jgi:hypothetical protein
MVSVGVSPRIGHELVNKMFFEAKQILILTIRYIFVHDTIVIDFYIQCLSSILNPTQHKVSTALWTFRSYEGQNVLPRGESAFFTSLFAINRFVSRDSQMKLVRWVNIVVLNESV